MPIAEFFGQPPLIQAAVGPMPSLFDPGVTPGQLREWHAEATAQLTLTPDSPVAPAETQYVRDRRAQQAAKAKQVASSPPATAPASKPKRSAREDYIQAFEILVASEMKRGADRRTACATVARNEPFIFKNYLRATNPGQFI